MQKKKIYLYIYLYKYLILVWFGDHSRRGGLPQHPPAPDGNPSHRQARITSAELGARSARPKRWRADTLASSGSQAITQRGIQER